MPASTAAPVFVAAGTDVSATFDTTLVIPVPAGTAQDDVMIASIGYQYSYETLTPPAGWTLLRQIYNNDVSSNYGKNALAVYWRVASSSEPASYTWTISGHEYAGSIQSFRGVNTTTPIDIEAGQTQPTGTSFATPSISTTLPNVLLVASHTFASADTWTPPSGMTETVDIASDPVPNVFSQSIEESYVVQSAIGSTGAKTATTNSGASYADLGNTHLLALVPSAITTLGSGTASIANTGSVTAVTTNFATTGVTFGTGDRLVLKVTAPEDANNCNVQLSYDGASVASRLVTATIVPEGVVGLLLLAPALPMAARWWKRRRP